MHKNNPTYDDSLAIFGIMLGSGSQKKRRLKLDGLLLQI